MSCSVLVVDDDPNILELVRVALKSRDYEVEAVSKVSAAIGQLAARAFDLIVTDLIMPDQDGMQFIAELRRRGSQARILAISGGGHLESDVYLEIAKRLRVDGVLAKPFDMGQLLEAVRSVL